MADADNLHRARISGTAQRLARAKTNPDAAAQELRDLAEGRTDLLAAEAGTALGGFLARPLYSADLLAAYYLTEAIGGDVHALAQITTHLDATRARLAPGGYTTQGTRRPVGIDDQVE